VNYGEKYNMNAIDNIDTIDIIDHNAIVGVEPKNSTKPVIYQLRDIKGLDPIPWWPPAPGWWLLLGGFMLTLWIIKHFLLKMYKIPNPFIITLSWKWDAAHQLRALRRRVSTQETWKTARELSELLRRIAMTKYGRDACAGLTGLSWLQWLNDQDPDYAWTERGQLLLTLPYAPPDLVPADMQRLLELIDAASAWLRRPLKQSKLEQT